MRQLIKRLESVTFILQFFFTTPTDWGIFREICLSFLELENSIDSSLASSTTLASLTDYGRNLFASKNSFKITFLDFSIIKHTLIICWLENQEFREEVHGSWKIIFYFKLKFKK